MRPQLLSAAGRSVRGFSTVSARRAATPYKFTTESNISGWTVRDAFNLGTTLAAFGGVTGYFALIFLTDIPRVRNDIILNIPFIGSHFVKEIHPADNPF